jgi:hypothetical protein
LAGSTKVVIVSDSGVVQRIPIEKLYKMWNSKKFKARNARSYDPDVQRFITAPIKSVYASGRKVVYEFTVQSSHSIKTIKCTEEHRAFTKEKGFVPFEIAYKENLTVALNGKQAEPLPYQNPKILRENAWMGSEKFAQEFGIAGVTARKWFRLHGITPARPHLCAHSSIDLPFASRKNSFMSWARNNCLLDKCEFCGHDGSNSRLELSHIIAHDGDSGLAFDENNLRTLCAQCHRKHDIEEQGKSYGWTLNMTAKWGKIIDKKFIGVEETYDIEMDHPTQNFVEEGIIVHNSTRYQNTNVLGGPEVPHLRRQDQKNRQNSIDDLDASQIQSFYRRISNLFEESGHLYQEMLSSGVAKECARSILPLATPTRLYMNGTVRSWITYLSLREKHGTQMEHMQVAKDIKHIFCGQLPTISEALGGKETDWEV